MALSEGHRRAVAHIDSLGERLGSRMINNDNDDNDNNNNMVIDNKETSMTTNKLINNNHNKHNTMLIIRVWCLYIYIYIYIYICIYIYIYVIHIHIINTCGERLGSRGWREMGGAPRNPAPRNHLFAP